MFFWHAGGAIFLFRWIFGDPAADLRFLTLGVLIPNLIDKPLALLAGPDQPERAFGHTLGLALIVLTVAMLVTRRGTVARKRGVVLAVGLLINLILDAMWLQQETLLWPLFGSSFSGDGIGPIGDWLAATVSNPVALAQEAVGLGYLLALARRAGLHDPERRAAFVRTGQIVVVESDGR